MRGRRLNQVMLLAAILAGAMLLAAHESLHDYDLSNAHHADHGQPPLDHQHPARTLAIAVFAVILIVVAFGAPMMPNPVKIGTDRFRMSVGPLRCDDDIGLHDVLSLYRI